MRRARIKAVATLPVRRKTAQDCSTTEQVGQTNKKITDKSIEEKSELKGESASARIEEADKINTREVAEQQTISSAKDKERFEIKVHDIESRLKNDGQKILKIDCQQKFPTTLVEGSSPIKTIQSRSCFMRPTPRLDGGGRVRRNSIQGSGASASESEDDSRRSNSIIPSRVRNDSVCSIQSLKDSSNVNSIAKLNLGQKRRMVVSESARKLAEARREFLLKHENKSPDKSKLTMYDLIYYNPTTNPMKPKPSSVRPSNRKLSICSIPEKKKEEEAMDEPAEMLVPQVKVGPNGQLIIDEKSLIIDQYKVQESIDRSDIIIDEDTTGNGFYKRRKKSKEWNKWETVKFYKALNTYGTDFLLMQSIFPMRTRQELKLKYKKEERLNRNLVEKALQYQEFDTETLEKDLASVEESERKESELNKVKKDTSLPIKRKRKRCHIVTEAINCDNDEQNLEYNKNTCDEQSSDENARITITKKIRKRSIRKRKTSKLDINIFNEELKDNSDSESEVYKAQPTRSGRKANKLQKSINIFDISDKEQNEPINEVDDRYNNNEEETEIAINESRNIENNGIFNKIKNNEILSGIDNQMNEIIEMQNDEETENQNELLEILGASSNISSNIFDGITDDIANIANLKPGSLIVLKKKCVNEPGKTNLQIFIVSADYDINNPNCKDSLLPIDLSPDILETVTNCIKDIEPQNIAQECNVP